MQEDTRPDPAEPGTIWVADAVRAGENLRLRGEDVHQESTLALAGTRLEARLLALLAASGLPRVRVGRRPAVALLATGNELAEAKQALLPARSSRAIESRLPR